MQQWKRDGVRPQVWVSAGGSVKVGARECVGKAVFVMCAYMSKNRRA